MITLAEREFYASQSATSDPGDRGAVLDPMPVDAAALVEATSGLVLHRAFVAPLGITPAPGSEDDVECRTMRNIVERLLARDGAPLHVRRPPERRFIGICRDYSLVACAALRHRGIPARLRVGFAGYFTPDYWEDHWVCEYLAGDRWRLLDPELSDRVRAHFGVAFSPADVPRDAFLTAGEAWRRIRAGRLDPARCGVSAIGVAGMGFAASSVLRDLAALNKREMLAWDVWGVARGIPPGGPVPEEAAARLDTVAALTADPDADWGEICRMYEREEFRVPARVMSFGAGGPSEVAVGEQDGR